MLYWQPTTSTNQALTTQLVSLPTTVHYASISSIIGYTNLLDLTPILSSSHSSHLVPSRSSQVPPRSRRCCYNTQPKPGVRKHYKNNLSFPSDSSGEVCSHCTHATYPRSAASSRCSPIIIPSPSPLSLAYFSYCSSFAQPCLTCYALPCMTASASSYLPP
jgi:hypothetical protein